METNRNQGKGDDMIVLSSLTNAEPPSHVEMNEHLTGKQNKFNEASPQSTHPERVCDDHTSRGLGWIQAGC